MLTEDQTAELVNLYHLARTALAGQKDERGQSLDTHYRRQLWASSEFNKKYPKISETAAYKALNREFAWRYR